MADAVAQFQNRPKPRQPAGSPPSALHRNGPAPQAKRDQHRIARRKTNGEIVAD